MAPVSYIILIKFLNKASFNHISIGTGWKQVDFNLECSLFSFGMFLLKLTYQNPFWDLFIPGTGAKTGTGT
jgi:hypothetical protein